MRNQPSRLAPRAAVGRSARRCRGRCSRGRAVRERCRQCADHAVQPRAVVALTCRRFAHAALRVDAAPTIAVPVAGLAVEIVARAQDGLRRFDIRLDPPELGRIDVRLDVDTAAR